jgi:hypothetical protein
MGVLGILNAAGALPEFFDLDEEYTGPALFSAALLLIATAAAWRAAQAEAGCDRTLLLLAGCFFAFLGLDELFAVHERVDFHAGIDWQLLYAPLGVAFAWGVWRITGFLGRRGPEARMIFLGLAAWVIAQVLEAAVYSPLLPSMIDVDQMSEARIDEVRHSLGYFALAIPEELLEMVGALLFAVAFARAASRRGTARH